MSNENRNLILFILGAFAVFGGYQYFYEKPRLEAVEKQRQAQATKPPVDSAKPQLDVAPTVTTLAPREDVIKADPRISIETPAVKGSINLKGARIDDIQLIKFQATTATDSPPVTLFSPAQTKETYYAEFGWITADPQIKLPDAKSLWKADKSTLTASTPVTLSWDNGQGLIFKQVLKIDENYMFSVHQLVENNSDKNVSVSAYGLLSQTAKTLESEHTIVHEGIIGHLNDKLQEVKFKDLEKDGKTKLISKGGWVGITNKYWLSTIVPDQDKNVNISYHVSKDGDIYRVQADVATDYAVVSKGQSIQNNFRLYSGAKSIELLDMYEKSENIPHFDLTVDFGWFYFITKPLFYVLIWFYEFLGNFGLAIIAMTILTRLLFLPLANKSYHAMAKLKEVSPQLQHLKDMYADDKVKLQQEMMGFYKKHKINPVSGCLPVLLQIPVFFALYKVLSISLEMRHAPFYGWIHDLSSKDPTTFFNLFGLIPWNPPFDFMMIGAWPLLMGITMFIQQKMSPQPMEAMQEKMMLAMPIIMIFLFSQFPAGLVLYWTISNVWSIGQQWVIMTMDAKKKQSALKD
jgi:YidC/Oxa1 family membrane protein insertase